MFSTPVNAAVSSLAITLSAFLGEKLYTIGKLGSNEGGVLRLSEDDENAIAVDSAVLGFVPRHQFNVVDVKQTRRGLKGYRNAIIPYILLHLAFCPCDDKNERAATSSSSSTIALAE